MKLATILLVLMLAGTAHAAPVTLDFATFFPDSDRFNVTGTFNYSSEASPTSINRGSLNNAIYTPTAWDFTIVQLCPIAQQHAVQHVNRPNCPVVRRVLYGLPYAHAATIPEGHPGSSPQVCFCLYRHRQWGSCL